MMSLAAYRLMWNLAMLATLILERILLKMMSPAALSPEGIILNLARAAALILKSIL